MIQEKIITLWRSNRLIKLGAGFITGAALGFAYWYFIGCNSGTCAITSSPVNSTLYGAMMGLVISYPRKKDKD